ncbi:DUF4867 family protein [Clostridium sp. SM-530-WT-3G]|uniref:DUF4867 family protein n=1 Tax=Clostridium sp. SM-530-WT-3G TaxID=2725303 RepID=UPI00145F5FAB|nr:DUF4867 family protein [Clostridium sp. SM-530-WT-3G]NME84314.1 DUF4867 family protein [Clostridium sp. SM-530-WT-3G]
MKIFSVNDNEFRKYGRVIKNYEFKSILNKMKNIECPEEVVYEASVKTLEDTEDMKVLSNEVYGGMPIQIGYCNGHNNKLNALEYHRDSEINIAATDLILLLGFKQDISDDFKYDSSKIQAFLVPEGTAIEVYATTLHYAPCNANENGFKCVVVLPKGTNTEIDYSFSKEGENELLFARNKWLIAHKDANISNAVNGINGINIEL